MSEKKEAIALKMMRTLPSLESRANDFFVSAQREVQKSAIDSVIEIRDALKDQIADLKEISLETDINKDMARLTRKEVSFRFHKLIQLEFELEMTEQELKIKQDIFDKYFS